MPTNSREKCRLCAKLSAQQAQQLHGLEGDGCWIPQLCYKRRTYYRHRDDYNRKRRQIYRTDTQDTTQIEEILPPAAPAAVLYLYRQRVDAPALSILTNSTLYECGKKVNLEPYSTTDAISRI